MAPYFSPARLAIAIQAIAVSISGSLEIALQKENLGNAIVSQRTILVHVERFIELRERSRQVALLSQPLTTLDRRPQPDLRGVLQYAVVRIDHDPPWLSESLDVER